MPLILREPKLQREGGDISGMNIFFQRSADYPVQLLYHFNSPEIFMILYHSFAGVAIANRNAGQY